MNVTYWVRAPLASLAPSSLAAKKIRDTYPASTIRQWYDAADLNNDGVLSIEEFFMWSMSNASAKHGAQTLYLAFQKFDTDGTGALDASEFAAVAKDMGFGAVTNHLFSFFDDNGSGAITYKELIASCERCAPTDPNTVGMLTSLIWACDEEMREAAAVALDTSGWVINGKDAASVRSELQQLLQSSGGHVADLLRIFDQDTDNSMQIDDMEFFTAMREKFGFKGSWYARV